MDKQIIIRPIITEKSSMLGGNNTYVFKVIPSANKIEIRKNVEKLFNVKVETVRTLNVKPRKKRVGRYSGMSAGWKKAMVTLKENYKIDNFEKLS